MNYQRKSCQTLSLTSKRKSQWQQVKIRWSNWCPHQFALGKFSSTRTTKSKKKKKNSVQETTFAINTLISALQNKNKRTYSSVVQMKKTEKEQVFKQDWKSGSSELKLKSKRRFITWFLNIQYIQRIFVFRPKVPGIDDFLLKSFPITYLGFKVIFVLLTTAE